jgi:mannose-1-phosphate guanylyltransferase
MAPLSWDTPKPMLDVLGRPILEHLLLHLEQFGVRDVWLNPGHLGDQVITRFRGPNKQNILFSNEGYYSDDGWEGVPLGSASTLVKLQRDNSAFVDDFIVICGDALIDLDFSKMMTCHKSSQAHITIATKSVASYDTGKYGIVVTDENGCVTDFQEKPSPDQAASNIASTGIYIISPDALELIGCEANQDIAQHLLPSLLRNGAKIQSFQEDFGWHDMGCGRDYAQVLSSALNGEIPGLDINGTEIAPSVWAAEDTDVSTKAHIAGPCYIGAGSVIRAAARLEGPCILGTNCRVEAGARLQNIILHSDTAIRSDSEISHHILSPFWAIETDKADGRTTATEPLDNVTRSSVPETFKPYWFGFGKVG